MPPLLRALRDDRSGASAIELVIVGAMLMGLVQATMDMAFAYSTKLKLEQAAGRTAELVSAPGTVALTYTNLSTEAATAYGQPLTSVTVDNWLECSGTRNASFTGSCAANQQTARYVSVQLVDEYVPMFSWGGLVSGSGPNNGFVLSGDATVRVQ
jgi:Flp pilus assembly protein TadG